MALFITSSGQNSYAVGGDVILLAGVTLWAEGIEAIFELDGQDRTDLRIDGRLYVSDENAVTLFADAGAPSDIVAVGATGGISAGAGFTGLRLVGHDAEVRNAGTIAGGAGVGLLDALFGVIENSGTIAGGALGGITCSGSNSVTIRNTGTISGDVGIGLSGSYAAILNGGTIFGTDPNRAAIDATGANGSMVIRNTGTIDGAVTAIAGGAASVNVVNAGLILGDVAFGTGGDSFDGRAGTVVGALRGGGGDDTIRSGAGDDSVTGDEGKDLLHGNAGDDLLDGRRGNDTLRGGTGDDVLTGGAGNDDFVLRRGEGDDRIADFGNAADDLDLSAFRFSGFAAVAALAADRAGGMRLDLRGEGGGLVFLDGFLKAQFDAGDVIL